MKCPSEEEVVGVAKRIYMEVTRDKYSLPIAVADTAQELARMRGVETQQVYQAVAKEYKIKKPRFVRVEIEEEE